MGLRFRKTISLFPGVRLNLSKSGVGVSAGVPGLRGSINSSGRVTGTVGIPGTGVSYVKTKKIFGKKTDKKSETKTKSAAAKKSSKAVAETEAKAAKSSAKTAKQSSVQVDANTLKSIHGVSDAALDWKAIAASPVAPDDSYDQRAWSYYYSLAPDVLKGDIDTYLKLIYEVNPLDDLLDYGENFEFGTDSGDRIEVEFVINEAALTSASESMSRRDYLLLLQDFICSVSLRVAGDMFALLPVDHVLVHTVLEGDTVFSVDFDRANYSKLNFSFIDPSNTATKFRSNMSFDEKKGFSPVNPL
ncbi:DUF4236 domain-containing protein [uncultured Ruminococcus sp.]|uniref:DUF4236 domain-containing protein n=1 Tax=uncultured Ruminococcus sp. TaxID=165186 RepID=UPI00292F506C|nr:DUF4236 domain-containing protein [uncultured Ruminococcus sp.]